MTYMYGQEVGEAFEAKKRQERWAEAWEAIKGLPKETIDEVPGLREAYDDLRLETEDDFFLSLQRQAMAYDAHKKARSAGIPYEHTESLFQSAMKGMGL